MLRYQTQVHIPPDRYLCLHLPDNLPEGRAIITVLVQPTTTAETASTEPDPDQVDIEWWEEFDDERGSAV